MCCFFGSSPLDLHTRLVFPRSPTRTFVGLQGFISDAQIGLKGNTPSSYVQTILGGSEIEEFTPAGSKQLQVNVRYTNRETELGDSCWGFSSFGDVIRLTLVQADLASDTFVALHGRWQFPVPGPAIYQ